MTALFPARYSDGQTAGQRNVRVSADPVHGLAIYSENGAAIAAWPAAEVRLIGRVDRDGTARLCRFGQAARLTVSDAAFVAMLRTEFPSLRDSPYRTSLNARRIALWAGGAIASLAVFFVVLIPLLARQFVEITPPWIEVRTGEWMAKYVVEFFVSDDPKRKAQPICRRAEGAAALESLTSRLTATMRFPFTPKIEVLNTAVVNAVALPGGRVFLFRGLIEAATHPNEIAGVLAHELAHAELRHPMQISIERASSSVVIGLLLGDAAGLSVAALFTSAVLGSYYSRGMEAEADGRAIAALRAGNLTTAPLADFFERLARQEKSQTDFPLISLFSTHPELEERAKQVRSAHVGQDALSAGQWLALRRICD